MSAVRATILALVGIISANAQRTTSSVQYEGGTLPLNQHTKLLVTLDGANMTFTQGGQPFAVSNASVTGVFYGKKVHERVKKGVGIGLLAVNPVAGAAVLLLRKGKNLYIGITWTESERSEQGGAILRLRNETDCRVMLAALTAATGKKPVNTDTASGAKDNQ